MNHKHTEKGTFDSKITPEIKHQIGDLIAQGASIVTGKQIGRAHV